MWLLDDLIDTAGAIALIVIAIVVTIVAVILAWYIIAIVAFITSAIDAYILYRALQHHRREAAEDYDRIAAMTGLEPDFDEIDQLMVDMFSSDNPSPNPQGDWVEGILFAEEDVWV